MTELIIDHLQKSEPFDERIELLTMELELAIRWQRPLFLLVVYSSEYVLEDAEAALENYLIDQGQKILHFHSDHGENGDINSLIQKIYDNSGATIFAKKVMQASPDSQSFYQSINRYKEVFVETNSRFILWLTQKDVVQLAHTIPDFWNLRNRIIELVDSPRPEQVLQNALEFAWQGIGEYTEHFEDTDAKIFMRESFLTELPKENESTTTRANLILTLGILNWRKGNYEKAEELLREALKIAIKIQDNWFEAECFNAMALVKTSMNRNDEAVDAYKQAIELAPDQIFAWNNLGNLCLKIQRNDEAMIAFQKAIKHNPKDSIAWNGLGTVYYKSGYTDDAIAAFRKAIEFTPNLSLPWNGLGDVYANIGRINEAVSAYQKSIELSDQSVTPWLRLADVYRKQDHHRDAIKAYQRALSIDPKNSQIWNDLGLLYLNSRAFEDAEDAFVKAAELDRGFGWAYGNLALTFASQGMHKEAIPLYLKSIDLLNDNKDKAISWNRLANTHRSLMDYEKAIAAYQKADMLGLDTLLRIDSTAADAPGPASVPEDGSLSSAEISDPNEDEKIDNFFISDYDTLEQDGTNQDLPAWIFQTAPNSEGTINAFSQDVCSVSTANISESSAKIKLEHPDTTDTTTLEKQLARVFSLDSLKIQENGETTMNMALPMYHQTLPEDALLQQKMLQPEFIELEEVKADSTNAYVWNEKGNIHFQAGIYDDAICAYNKAIELDQFFGWPYANLALTYLMLGRYTEAVLLYQKSIQLLTSNKEKAASWNGLGNLYRFLNEYDHAVLAYQTADELDPENAGIHDSIGYFHSEPNAKNAQVWDELGDIFLKAGSYSEAENAYKKAIELDAMSGWSYGNLALTLVHRGRYQDAIHSYLKSIEVFKDNKDKAISWNRLGNVYRKLNDYDNAITAYQNAVKLNDEHETLLTRTRFSLLGNCCVD
ncbi:MAG: tetratricopeptide repeat protein [Anaerolineales bacterium]|nr:tetratricopeptide repeat protein [Anaerolineales bacterium]